MGRALWSNDIRSTKRYTQVRAGSGPGGTGEVGTLRHCSFYTQGFRYRIAEFVSADGYYVVWGTGEGKHTKYMSFPTQQQAADYAIEEMERTRHIDRCQIS